MKITCLTVVFVLFISTVVCATSVEEDHAKIISLFEKAVYKNDPSIKITSFDFKQESRSEGDFRGKKPAKITEGWRTNIILISQHKTKAQCDVMGYFTLTNGKKDETSKEAVLYSGEILPDASARYTSGVIVNINRLPKISSFVIETTCESIQSLSKEEGDTKIMRVFKGATYKKDPGIKVLEASYTRTGSDEYSDIYESVLKLKSCYTTKMECSATGQFNTTVESINLSRARNPFFGVFPINSIDKQGTAEGKGIIKVRKDLVDVISSFNIKVDCNPIYSEHPNIYPPSHKYWKQFLPKKNECN